MAVHLVRDQDQIGSIPFTPTESMMYRIERWLPPRRDKKTKEIIAPGRWLVFTRDEEEPEAEKTIRRIASYGGIARALSSAGGMLARPDTFARWSGSGGYLRDPSAGADASFTRRK